MGRSVARGYGGGEEGAPLGERSKLMRVVRCAAMVDLPLPGMPAMPTRRRRGAGFVVVSFPGGC